MKCPRCDGNGKYKTIFGNIVICDFCYGTGEIAYSDDNRIEPIGNKKPKTNEEWFCTLSTEEKARFFDKICYSAWGDINSRFRDMADYTDWVEWLKQPHQ